MLIINIYQQVLFCYSYPMSSPSKPQVISISLGTILKVVAILLGLALIWAIRDILLYVFVAFLLAGVMYPLAKYATAYRIPKGVAVMFFYLLTFGITGLVVGLLIPAVRTQALSFFQSHGDWVSSIGGMESLQSLRDPLQNAPSILSRLEGIQAQLQQTSEFLFSTLGNVFGGVAAIVVVLVLAFYIVVEDSAIKNLFDDLVPEEYREDASQFVLRLMDKLGAWMRGQLLLGLIIGVLYFVAFAVAGVPYPLLLALLGGLLEFIPYIGPFIAAVPAIILALSVSPTKALIAFILILIIQQLENNVIVPKIMQKTVGLNPIVSIVAFMIGAQLFGVVGAIFSIPVATAFSVALEEYRRLRKGTSEKNAL